MQRSEKPSYRAAVWMGVLSVLLGDCAESKDRAAADSGSLAQAEHPGSSSDAGRVDDAAAVSCDSSETGTCPLPDDFQFKRLFDATDFGPDARLAALGGRSVLVTAPDSPPRIVQIDGPVGAPSGVRSYVTFGFPETDLDIIDVANDLEYGRTATSYALGCRAGHCSLWRTRVDREPTLEQVAGSDLDWVPRGLVFDVTATPPAICAFGHGLKCFEGTWNDVIPYENDIEIVDVAVDNELSLAVGTQGHYWTRSYDPVIGRRVWSAHSPLAGVELSTASVTSSSAAAVGPKGWLFTLSGETTTSCQWGGDLAFARAGGSPGQYGVVTKQGRVLRPLAPPATGHCLAQSLELDEILASNRVSCGASNNIWVMTADAVFGELTCLEVP